MTYSLSFGPAFFRDEWSREVLTEAQTGRPTSVSQALSNLSRETWSKLAREVFHCGPEYLDIETALQKIAKSNTCLNLDSPVEVAIDPDGDFTVLVYDSHNR